MLSGRIRTYASSAEGRDVVLGDYGPGKYFGELALDGGLRSASVKTLEPTTCRVVQGAERRAFLAEQPDFAVHLSQKLVRTVRRLTEQVKGLALQEVYGRMVNVPMELSDVSGSEHSETDFGWQRDRRFADRRGVDTGGGPRQWCGHPRAGTAHRGAYECEQVESAAVGIDHDGGAAHTGEGKSTTAAYSNSVSWLTPPGEESSLCCGSPSDTRIHTRLSS